MVQQGFFSGSASKSQRIANAGASTPVRIDTVTTGDGRTFKRVLPNFGGGRVGEIRLKKAEADNEGKSFFSPRLNDVKVATTGNLPSDYTSTEDDVNFNNYLQKNFKDADLDYGSKSIIRDLFKNEQGGYDAPYQYDPNPLKYQEGSFLNKAKNTKIAQADTDQSKYDSFDNYLQSTYGFDTDSREWKSIRNDMKGYIRGDFNDDRNKLKYQEGSLLNQTKPEGNIFTRTAGSIFNALTGTQSVAAGTLDDNKTRFAGEADPTPRPKLDYVNPDRTIMTRGEMRDAFRPSNLFGYKDKFGRYGAAVEKDRQETISKVAQRYSSMPAPDARSINQIRVDRATKMKDDAKARQAAFKETGVQTFGGKVQPQKSADVTYNTNMYSNPAYGFRSKMKPEDQKKYDASAKYATEAARPDPSIGNVLTSLGNIVKKALPNTPLTRQASLESIGERQMRLAGIEVNRPTYQKEAYARNYLGISPQFLKDRNMQIIRQNAKARNEAFKNEKAQKAAERSAKRLGGNIGTGRDGGFGTGTQGKGMPSNPGSQRQTGVGVSANNLSRHKAGHSSSQPSSSGSRSQGRGGRRGGSSGGSGSSSKGGTGSGGTSTSRSASKASKSRTGRSRSQCDIRTKIDIAPLTNPNLIRDDLANIAYFVKEIK